MDTSGTNKKWAKAHLLTSKEKPQNGAPRFAPDHDANFGSENC